MLEIQNVAKVYDNHILALDGVDLLVDQGEIVCLLGPSGCGKTTLLRIVAGLEQADRGEIWLHEQNLSSVPVHRRRFGYMFQDFALFPHKSVAENVAFGLRMANLRTSEIDSRVHNILELVGLKGYGDRSVFELSGGERQRVALARSLAPSPQLLMLDEPLGSLDRTLRESLIGELHAILKQVDVTAIYVTHDQEEAFAIGDKLAIMRSGKVEQIGSPEDVYKRPISVDIARFLGLTSLIPIQVAADDANTLRTPLGSIPRRLIPDPVPASGAMMLIRPDSARLAFGIENDRLDFPYLSVDDEGSATTLRLAGNLVDCSFRGSQYRLKIVAPGHEETPMTFDLPAYQTDFRTGQLRAQRIPAIGAPIHLHVFPELTTVFPMDEP